MKLVIGWLALVISAAMAVPAQAQPTYIEDKGITYAVNANGQPRISAIATSTGVPVWTTVLVGSPGVPPDLIPTALALHKTVLYVSAFSDTIARNTGVLFTIDTASGQILWIALISGGGIFSAATVDKDVVYVTGWALGQPSKTTALNAITGQVIWQSNTPHPAFSSPTVDKDTLVVVTGGFSGFPTFLVLFDAATGQILQSGAVP